MPVVYPVSNGKNDATISMVKTFINDFATNVNTYNKHSEGRRGKIIHERAVGLMRNIISISKSGATRERAQNDPILEFLVENEKFFREQIAAGFMDEETKLIFEAELAKHKQQHAAELQAKRELDNLMDGIIADLNKQLREATKVNDLLNNENNKEQFEYLSAEIVIVKDKIQSVINLANDCKGGKDKYKELAKQITELKELSQEVLDNPEHKQALNNYPSVKGFFNNIKQIATKFLNFITGNKFDCFAPAQKSILKTSAKHNEQHVDKLKEIDDKPEVAPPSADDAGRRGPDIR